GEHAQLGLAHGEPGTGAYGRQEDLTEAFAAPLPVEGGHGLPEVVACAPIVALMGVGLAEAHVCERLLTDIPAGRREREGALASRDTLVVLAYVQEMV